MNDFFQNAFFGIVLTLMSYEIGLWLRRKTGLGYCNPLFIAMAITISFLLITGTDTQTYDIGASYIKFLLTPATIAFAIPLYRQAMVLKKNLPAILTGILGGCIACICSIFIMCKLFGLPYEVFAALAPKSVTTPIAIGIAEEVGGVQSITVIAVILTGILGAASVEFLRRIFKIKDNVAFGLATGNASHAIGTTAAMEINEVAGAMSSLSIVIAGLMTVVIVPIAARFY